MFKLAKVNRVYWPVTVQIPQDGGTSQKATFEAQFEILSQDEADAVVMGRNDAHTDLLDRVLVGWKNVRGAEGEAEIPFTDEAKKQLLEIPYVRTGLMTAYAEASIGGRRKN